MINTKFKKQDKKKPIILISISYFREFKKKTANSENKNHHKQKNNQI